MKSLLVTAVVLGILIAQSHEGEFTVAGLSSHSKFYSREHDLLNLI